MAFVQVHIDAQSYSSSRSSAYKPAYIWHACARTVAGILLLYPFIRSYQSCTAHQDLHQYEWALGLLLQDVSFNQKSRIGLVRVLLIA